jgi:hypothetical protein
MHSLSTASDILRGDRPLPVVVASDPYAELLDNWISHIRRLGITRFLIVAMDDALEERLSGRGLVVARSSFDGSAEDFWLRRLLVWQHLVHIGVHVVQSDVDAIWLRDPTEPFFRRQRPDLLCTQGTFHPGDIAALWGFVLCTGLMSIRPTHPARRFLDRFVARAEDVLRTDDQAVMNRMLAESGLVWDRHGLQPEINELEGDPFTSYPGIIDATDLATGSSIGLLPHHLFPRVPTASTVAYVKHPLRPVDDANRIDELRTIGCWLI